MVRTVRDELQRCRDLLAQAQEQLKKVEADRDSTLVDKYPGLKEMYQDLVSAQKQVITNVQGLVNKHINKLKQLGETE